MPTPKQKKTTPARKNGTKKNGKTVPVAALQSQTLQLPPGVEVLTQTLDQFNYDAQNLNDHTPRGHSLLTRELQQNGMGRSIFVTADGVVKAGNLTKEVAHEVLGNPQVIVVRTHGDVPIVHQRMDIESGDERAIEMGLADNWIANVSLNFNPEAVAALDLSNPELVARYLFREEVAGVLAGRPDLIGWSPLPDAGDAGTRPDGAELVQIAVDDHEAIAEVIDGLQSYLKRHPQWNARVLTSKSHA
jgi:hypothetical protein